MKFDANKFDHEPIKQNIALYDREARRLALQYDSLNTQESLPIFCTEVLKRATTKNTSALDIGCGTGRDALWMAQQGLRVTGVDGSGEMISIARETKPHAQIDYTHSAAPDFSGVQGRFDVILANAFVFHLDADARAVFYDRLKDLAAPGAYAYLTLRHGPIPEGRAIYDVSVQEITDWAQKNGFICRHVSAGGDMLGRGDVTWDHVVVEF